MNVGIILLYVVAVGSFAPPLLMAGFLWSKGRVPLAANYLRFQTAYLVFLLGLFGAFLGLTYWPGLRWPIEVLFNTLFFVLYAALGLFLARFLIELVQKRWEGRWRRAVEVFALLGIIAPLVIHAVVFEGIERALVLRIVLNGGYFFLFLTGVTALFLRTLWFRKTLADEWKRGTLRGAVIIFLVAIPFFLVDAFWPLLQSEYQWIPRGLNIQVFPLLVWNAFFTWRWFTFPLHDHEPLTGDPSPALMELMTGREREIALLLLEGKSNQEICDVLNVRMGTTKNHIYNIFNKTGASSRKEFCRMLMDR